MKMGKMPFLLFGLALLVSAEKSQAQMWGTGMYGGMQACPYELQIGDAAASIKEEIEGRNEELKDMKAELSKLKSKQSSLKSQVSSQRDLFKLSGKDGDAFSLIENHINGGLSCDKYEGGCPRPGRGPNSVSENETEENISRMPAADMAQPGPGQVQPPPSGVRPPVVVPGRPACGTVDHAIPTSPFDAGAWQGRYCGRGEGQVNESICGDTTGRPRGYNFESCKRYLRGWIEKKKELDESERRVLELTARVKELEAVLKANKVELREAIREYTREMRREQTEGGCINCMISASGAGVFQQRRASGWEVGANVLLGLGAMYLGNQNQRYITDQNARLGFPTQPYPAIGYGMPFFTGALYGAIGGSMGGGSFGCAGGAGGAGFGNGPYGMMGPMGMGGMYGPQGGAFGYPQGMFGSPMGGGMFMPGMGPFGMAGPFGNAMCASWPCPMGGGMGMGFGMGGPMGMQMGMGAPMGMGMQMGMGGPMGFGMAMGGMMPGMAMGGMMPGMAMGGMMPGMAMGGMMPGMAMGGMMPGMGADGGMAMQMQMQMQQQMMQMQMQQYQQYVSMQQQRYQQQMAQAQVISGLTQEMYTLMYRIQQAQMGMYTGGYVGVGGMPGVGGGSLLLPGQSTLPGLGTPTLPGSLVPGTPTGTAVPSYR